MSDKQQTPRQSGLRMAAGGSFGKWIRETVFNAPKDYQPAASAQAPAKQAPAEKAITEYSSGAAVERRMKAAGLRDGGDLRTGAGGHVPGKGTGDKVPAKYEPGEFVVSNDMLDAAPGLREDLHSLRGQVLAAKGMTPEQADAKALRGGSLRAAAGFETRPNVLAIPGTTNADVGRTSGFERAPDWTQDSELGRNVSNALSALAPVTGGLSHTLRAGATAGKLFNVGVGVTAPPIIGASIHEQPKPAAPQSAAPAPQAAQSAVPQPAAPQPAHNLRSPGVYETRRPNKPVEFGDEASLTDVGFQNRGAISTQNMTAADALSARYAGGLREQTEPTRPNVFVGRDTGGYGLLDRDRLRERSLRMDADQLKPGSRGALRAFYERQSQGDKLASDERTASAGDATTRRGQDLTAATTLRGQDVTAGVKAREAESARATADREYALNVQKFGVEAANKRRDDKRAGEAAFDQRVLSFVGTDKDGKPDAAAASRVRNVANAFLSEKLTAARQLLAREPNNKSALAVIDSITREGVGGIDDDTMRQFLLNEQGNRVAAEYDGWAINPFAGKATNTSRPIGSLRLEDNMILPNQYVTENDQKIPKRAVEANPDLRALIK